MTPAFDAVLLALYKHSNRHVHLTLRDVATEAGYATSTVSTCLNEADRLGYVERLGHRAGAVASWRLLVLGREFCQRELGAAP